MKLKRMFLTGAFSVSVLLGLSGVSHAATFVMEKRNARGFSIDGNGGARVGQQIYLWNTNVNNTNQNWDQLRRGDFFAYRKEGTNLCWDGGRGGERLQAVTLQVCDEDNQDQHWRRIKMISGTEIYRLEKRNAPGFSIDGNGGGARRQSLYLWNSNDNNQNQHWDFIRTDVPGGGNTSGGSNNGGGSDGGASSGNDDRTTDNGSNSGSGSNSGNGSNTGSTTFVRASDVNVDSAGNLSGRSPICQSAAPSTRFDLSDWGLDTPREDPDRDGRGHNLNEEELDGFVDRDYFCLGRDGGMVFNSTVEGFRTSSGTSFTRSELRELLRRGDDRFGVRDPENNWVFSTQPSSSFTRAAAGVDGTLRVTMAVNHVTTTGDGTHPGRTIIGQIHAADDEPSRLYYHKLPGNRNGSIYMATEERNGRDALINIIGSESRNQSNPSQGIPLNEPFTYEIRADGDLISVVITKANGDTFRLGDDVNSDRESERDVDNQGRIRALGYNRSEEYMYFKAGAYTQNNTGDDDDFDQVTIYSIENTHN